MAKSTNSKQPPTAYVVIEVVNPDHERKAWALVEGVDEDHPVMARGDTAAIKQATLIPERVEGGEAQGDEVAAEVVVEESYREGEFKAIPLRSWKGGLRNRNKQVVQPRFEAL